MLTFQQNGDGQQVYPTLKGVEEDERSEEHTSELQSPCNLVCRLLLEKKKKICERRRQPRGRGSDNVLFLPELDAASNAQPDVPLPRAQEGLLALIGTTTRYAWIALKT